MFPRSALWNGLWKNDSPVVMTTSNSYQKELGLLGEVGNRQSGAGEPRISHFKTTLKALKDWTCGIPTSQICDNSDIKKNNDSNWL